MRTYLLALVLALMLGALLIWLMQAGSGYVLVSLGQTAVEMSFWSAGILLLLLVVGLYGGIALAGWLARMGALSNWWRQRRHSDRQQRSQVGLRAYALGLWDMAAEQLQSVSDVSSTASVQLLLAARAQAQIANFDGARAALERYKTIFPNAAADADLILADILIDGQKFAEAKALVATIKSSDAADPARLSALIKAHIRCNQWPQATALLPTLGAAKGVCKASLATLELHVYRGQLGDFSALSEDTASSPQLRRERLEALWKRIPRGLKKRHELVAPYAACLDSLGAGAEAKALLVKTLKTGWQPELAGLFGSIQQPTTDKHLACAENWLVAHPKDAHLLIALGQICRRLRFFVKATDYLQRAHGLSPSPRVLSEMAAVKADMGDAVGSARLYREGLLAALSSRSDTD